jgi:Ran GTPase-activating protein (RanGAP) involved in mRNA processing and transport
MAQSSIVSLDTSGNKITIKKETNSSFANFLGNLPMLKELNLSSTKISHEILKFIIDSSARLEIIDLSDNEIGDEGNFLSEIIKYIFQIYLLR